MVGMSILLFLWSVEYTLWVSLYVKSRGLYVMVSRNIEVIQLYVMSTCKMVDNTNVGNVASWL